MKMFYDKVYGKTIDGIKDLLRFLLSEPSTGRALKRQVAFLFFFTFFTFSVFIFCFFRQVAFFFFYVIFLLLFSIFFRQVAFLFDFEEIEHTTVLGLTLQVNHKRLEYWSQFLKSWTYPWKALSMIFNIHFEETGRTVSPSIIMFLSWHAVHQYGPH